MNDDILFLSLQDRGSSRPGAIDVIRCVAGQVCFGIGGCRCPCTVGLAIDDV